MGVSESNGPDSKSPSSSDWLPLSFFNLPIFTRFSGQHDLAAVTRSADSRCAMHAHADVARPGHGYFARMNSHPRPNGLAVRPCVPGERALCIQRGLHSIQRMSECDEKKESPAVSTS